MASSSTIRPLPPGHFLSLPPTYADPCSPGTSSHASNGLAPNVASLAAADYDVDVRTGFLPGTKNIQRLPAQWAVWEDALSAARSEGLRLGGAREIDQMWRRGVETMPILPVPQDTLPLLRRAHLVLSFVLHFYVHTTTAKPVTIPPPLAVPLVTVSRLLGLPPVVTYSDTVLYNFLPNDPAAPVSTRNIPTRCLESFTNTRSEEQFYVISAQCEIAGAEALRLMRQSLDELFLADVVAIRRLTAYLKKLAAQIELIGEITLSMIQHVDPAEFYHLIRPWFRGGDADGPNSLGWIFQGIDAGSSAESAVPVNGASLFSGPSAGQSSLIHAIDIFLTVNHTDDDKIVLDQEPIGAASKPNEATFVERMLQYMPAQHRSFLQHLAQHPTPLRQLVVAAQDAKLTAAYDKALEALKSFREKHMRIVSIFIVQQARKAPSEAIQALVGPFEPPQGELRGTGGSALFVFLKRCRDNTKKAMVGDSAGPDYRLE